MYRRWKKNRQQRGRRFRRKRVNEEETGR